jgi:hypothetical protein
MKKENLIIMMFYIALLICIIYSLTACSTPKTGCRYVVHKKAYKY